MKKSGQAKPNALKRNLERLKEKNWFIKEDAKSVQKFFDPELIEGDGLPEYRLRHIK